MSTTRDVLEHHLDAFGSQDLEATMADYVEDSVIVTNMGTSRGLDEIEELFAGLYRDFSQEGSIIEVEQQEIEGDVAYIVWHGETPTTDYEFCTDTFLIEDGNIVFQTFAGKIEEK